MKLNDLFEKIQCGGSTAADAEIQSVRFFREEQLLEVTIACEKPLLHEEYSLLKQKLMQCTGCRCRILMKCTKDGITTVELNRWLTECFSTNAGMDLLSRGMPCYQEKEHTLAFLFQREENARKAQESLPALKEFLNGVGITDLQYSCRVFENKTEVKTVSQSPAPAAAARPAANGGFDRRKSYSRKMKKESWPVIRLKDVRDPADDVQFIGTVFKKEDIEIRSTGHLIQNLSVFDGEDAILVKRFEGRNFTREELDAVHENDRVHVYGSIIYDTYAKDLVCQAAQIDKLDPVKTVDPAADKRIELHCHTNMSEMDGVCETPDIIKYVWDLGHEGVAITDHADVQGFVKAFNTAAALKKSDPGRKFKIALGCEMNMVDDQLTIVRNGDDQKLSEAEYVCYDLETTGLSCHFDHIIEFGAVKMKNQTVIDRKQMFIKPPVPIPYAITRKTNITNDMVKDAKSFDEAADELVAWIGDAVLVAHNATFDYFFLNEELRNSGRKPLLNPVIDTLDLARAVLPERRAYRLGNIARYYRISYDEETAHRADYDAEELANVFLCLLKDAGEEKKDSEGRLVHGRADTIRQLQEQVPAEQAFLKARRSHINVLAKDQHGIKDLYQLVTLSNTKYLSVMGKASGKDGTEVVSEPRITRSELEKHHEHLLFGSACLNGEVFELACNADDERLARAVDFYDYIELQPLDNYSTYIAMGNLPGNDRLKAVQKRILAMAAKEGKPVAATSDAHYCTKDQKRFRDVYIMNQGVGGVTHPLFIRDDELRLKTENPDQHIRLTDEMKNEFAWLQDPDLVDQIVVENPHRIFGWIAEARPVPEGTFPPSIEGSSEKLSAVCYKTAHEVYGEPLPEIVEARLKKELNAIIEHGYSVVYYIAHLLVKKSNEDGYLVGSRGSVGSSFVATMSGITEVNPLKPHYVCPKCHHCEWIEDPEVRSGFDLPDKACPECGTVMKGNGQNIPFETFLGFHGDKVPDIDLNFSNEYQAKAHAFTKTVFGDTHVYRAGTIGTVAEKTAYGYVSGYCEKMNIQNMRRTFKDYLAHGCENVKRTTGQHPGGIIVIPNDKDASDFTPVQYPANDPNSEWKTTHFDFHDIHDNVLKFDILGHVDPTAMRLLQSISGIDPKSIPMNDPDTLSLFSSDRALKADPRVYHQETGALGLPEFGTKTTRRVLEITRPKKFSDLVIISGLSHGTDVWAGNAQTLIEQGHTLEEVIGCRDDIMTYLLGKNLEPKHAFDIMEHVRKGKGLKSDEEQDMKDHNVPEWYIESCKKIKYMFPKAHAVAYVIMALRIAWFKVHYPHWFYVQFLTLRSDAYEIETMTKGLDAVRARMADIDARMNNRNTENPVTNKERSLYDVLEVCEEIYARGYRIGNIDLYKSKATEFSVEPGDTHTIIPPFTCIDGLGANVARSVEEAREKGPFLSVEDIQNRTQLSGTLLKKLETLGCLNGLQERNQMSLF